MGDQYKPVVDRQFVGDLWPLWIQVETKSMPTLAVVTFNAQAMNKVLLNVVNLDGGKVIIKKGGSSGGGNSGGGGTELEGEYFLAKPNGRYWKFTFMPEGHKLRIEDFETSQIDAMIQAYGFLLQMQCISGAAVSTGDASLTDTEAQADGFYNIGSRINGTLEALKSYKQGYDYDPFEFNDGFLRVWRECDIKSNPPVEIQGFSLNNVSLIELMKEAARLQGMEITDDEAIPLLEQSLMITPATEEEYKYWRREE